MRKQSFAVIGAGTAGLAAAILLARQGHAVTVFERVPELKAVGAGILLQPSGMAALSELGALEACARLAAPIERLYGTSGQRVVLNTKYDDWRTGSVGMGIHRGVLMHALQHVAQCEHIVVKTGVEVDRFEQNEQRVRLFTQQSMLGEFDALILADGTRSQLRSKMRVKQKIEPYPWGALWAILPTPLQQQNNRDLRQWYRGSRQMFGLMPTGSTFDKPTQQLTSLFWSLPIDEFGRWQEEGLEAWKQQVLQLSPEAEPFLAMINAPEQLMLARYADVRMHVWHDERVIALGDCAHAMSPQLGQGANMALVDALVLSRVCQAQNNDDIRNAFLHYSKMRKNHLTYYRQASRLLTPLFQSHSRIFGAVRDVVLVTTRHTQLGRTQSVETLVGSKTGWLQGHLADKDLYAWIK
ncbi:FAD-dependent oxidoreductase [Hydromonas duriensis]|uniref:2-polyprenyl-6-methoxyphenol hydroxylase-like FAD-dependent oxidoreductase n=1 Tax=Hydromonas duriensis TaxID=1527608 RepID=A0A4R6Y978_9BURK|nr:NAD(P)/FAD-dependent oxidoreductase [Hydromonas duriensis]TDR31987.1 2-polyprenyl-6-methoxyphenol hydroxylase-like FAD-dependent oxidoreductase [Hydromonas duriensis]